MATITYKTDKTIADVLGGATNGDTRNLAMIVFGMSAR